MEEAKQVDIFENLDKLNKETHEEFETFDDEDSGRVCDKCSDPVSIPFYTSDYDIDLCETCYSTNLKDLFKVEEIDRTTFSTEEKPRIWPCLFCGEKMGGGCKWHVIESQVGYSSKFDVCSNCYEEDLTEKIKTLLQHISGGELVCCMRVDPVFLDIGEANRNLDLLPEEIKKEITKERVDEWADLVGVLAHMKPGFATFGSVKNWTLFTDIVDVPHFHAMTGLIVDCSNSRVGSLVIDDHGRCGVDIVFDSSDEYLVAKQEWEKTKLNKDDEEFKRLDQKVQNDFRTKYCCEDDELAAICPEFSGYYRVKNELGMYYG